MFSYFTEPANKECKNIESAANYARHPTPPMEERAPKSSRRGPSSTQRKIRCPEFADYGAEILEMMFAQQLKSTVTPEYMQLQPELTWPMRETLIRWLIQVHAEYNLQQESLYLAIHIIDRISSIRRIAKDQYQLLGTTALWVASKYEENHGRVPTLKNLAFICMQRYREADFVQTERLILESLKFDLSHPTPEAFLRTLWAERLLVADDVQTSDRLNAEIRSVARYLMEIGTVAGPDGFFVACSSSMIATAALQLAEEICLPPSMTSSYLATYNPPLPSEAAARAKECYNVLALCVGKGCEVVRNKYATRSFHDASGIVQTWLHNRRTSSFGASRNMTPVHPLYPPRVHHQHYTQNPPYPHCPPPGLLTPPKDGGDCYYTPVPA